MLNASLKLRIKWGNLLKNTQVQQEEEEQETTQVICTRRYW